MPSQNRLLRILLALVVAAIPLPASSATAAPAVPSSEAEWLSMSAAEQAAVMEYLRQQLDDGLKDGTLEIHEVTSTDASGAVAGLGIAAITATRQCVVQWTTVAGGDWVRGGGWTDASATMSTISAGLKLASPYNSGQLLRDGVHKGYWGQSSSNSSHAESYTGWHWTFAWETSTWFTKGWHTARLGSTYYIGPDSYCTASKLL